MIYQYHLYQLTKNLEKVLPSLESEEVLARSRNDIFESNKYDTHTNELKKIQKKEFTNEDFSF